MQCCPTCNLTYPDDAPPFCPDDGTPLVRDATAPNPQPATPALPYSDPPQHYAAQQQWAQAPVRSGGSSKLLLGTVVVLLMAGTGVGVYLLTKGSGSPVSNSNSSPSNSNTSAPSSSPAKSSPTPSSTPAANRFVGTWEGKTDTIKINADGTWESLDTKNTLREMGVSSFTYTLEGDTLILLMKGARFGEIQIPVKLIDDNHMSVKIKTVEGEAKEIIYTRR